MKQELGKDLQLIQTLKKNQNEKTIHVKYVEISKASDIEDIKYNQLLMKQQQNKAPKVDKLQIERHVIKKRIGFR